MPVPTTAADLSTTAASNSPAGGDAIGTSHDDYMRATFAIIKQQDSRGSDIASATTIDVPSSGKYFVVTGTTTISGISDDWNGRVVVLKFSGALQLTHSSALILPSAANITTADGDCLLAVNESTGVWRVAVYQRASGAAISGLATTDIGVSVQAYSDILAGVAAGTTQLGFRNKIINGGMRIAQRGPVALSASANTTFFADRWTVQASGGSGLGGNGAAAANSGFASGVYGGALGANWTTATMKFQTRLESNDTIDLSRVTTAITVSGRVLHNVGSTRTMQVVLSKPTTTADTFSALTTLYTSSTFTVADSTTTSFSVTFTLTAAQAALGLHVSIEDTATSSATGKNFGVGDVQLEAGSVATPFEYRPYGTELALCQRYYFRHTPAGNQFPYSYCYADSTTTVRALHTFPVQMRIAPTALEQTGTATDYSVRIAGTTTACSAVPVFNQATPVICSYTFTVAAGLTAGQAGETRNNNVAASYLGWSAEL